MMKIIFLIITSVICSVQVVRWKWCYRRSTESKCTEPMSSRLILLICCCNGGMRLGEDNGYWCNLCPAKNASRFRQLCEDRKGLKKDECSLNKDLCTNGKCINTQPGVKCECNNGYRLVDNKFMCKDIDECTEHDKLCKNGQCKNMEGSYRCICNPGYRLSSDGLYCLALYFGTGIQIGTVKSKDIREASGICASRQHSNVIYTHNDSGGKNRVFAIDKHSGKQLAILILMGAESHDWEDIACGPCPDGGHCVYVADVGGNAGGQRNNIYKFREPGYIIDRIIHISHADKLHFRWDQDNSETLMVAPDAEIYIVSKVFPGEHAKVIHVPKSGWGTGETVTISNSVYVSFTSGTQDPVGGDISPDGREILLKQYNHVLYWTVLNQDFMDALQKEPTYLLHRKERKGEAICWETKGTGYYTLSEGVNVPLYFYRRKKCISK